MTIGPPLAVALALNGILAGMTTDQSIKQLPARRKIGISAYSAYSRASDLGNGIVLYTVFGLAAPLSALIFAIAARRAGVEGMTLQLTWLAAIVSISQLGFTAFAAPTNFSQTRYDLADTKSLTSVFVRFARIQTGRTIVVIAGFLLLLAVTVRLLR